MLLSKGIPEKVLVARMVGVDEFIVRPATLEVLEAKIAKVLGLARLDTKKKTATPPPRDPGHPTISRKHRHISTSASGRSGREKLRRHLHKP